MKVIGAISGSSLDGLDLVMVDFHDDDGEISWDILSAETVPFDVNLRDRLAQGEDMSTRELCRADALFARFSADAIREFINTVGVEVDYIASHGHTITHHPKEGYSLQIGSGAMISELTGIPTLCDFRMNDVALGGEGAPIAPIVEQYLLSGHDYYLNLGGIANVSHHTGESIVSFDVCPCNQILNAEAAKMNLAYDEGGRLASQGKVRQSIVDDWGRIAYFEAPIPKSLDNRWVMTDFYAHLAQADLSVEDALATTVEFISNELSRSIGAFCPPSGAASLLATGGGAHNDYLLERIADRLADMEIAVIRPEPMIIDNKEALLMALMGFLRIMEVPNTIPTVTGASKATIGGAMYVPSAVL